LGTGCDNDVVRVRSNTDQARNLKDLLPQGLITLARPVLQSHRTLITNNPSGNLSKAI
jgi:hypothetical protein